MLRMEDSSRNGGSKLAYNLSLDSWLAFEIWMHGTPYEHSEKKLKIWKVKRQSRNLSSNFILNKDTNNSTLLFRVGLTWFVP